MGQKKGGNYYALIIFKFSKLYLLPLLSLKTLIKMFLQKENL